MTEPTPKSPEWSALDLPVLTEVADDTAVPTLGAEELDVPDFIPPADTSKPARPTTPELKLDLPPDLDLDELLEEENPPPLLATAELAMVHLPSLDLNESDAEDLSSRDDLLPPKRTASTPTEAAPQALAEDDFVVDLSLDEPAAPKAVPQGQEIPPQRQSHAEIEALSDEPEPWASPAEPVRQETPFEPTAAFAEPALWDEPPLGDNWDVAPPDLTEVAPAVPQNDAAPEFTVPELAEAAESVLAPVEQPEPEEAVPSESVSAQPQVSFEPPVVPEVALEFEPVESDFEFVIEPEQAETVLEPEAKPPTFEFELPEEELESQHDEPVELSFEPQVEPEVAMPVASELASAPELTAEFGAMSELSTESEAGSVLATDAEQQLIEAEVAPQPASVPSEFESAVEPELAAFSEAATTAEAETAELVAETFVEPAAQAEVEDLSQLHAAEAPAAPTAELELAAFSAIETATETEEDDWDFEEKPAAQPEVKDPLLSPTDQAPVESVTEAEPAELTMEAFAEPEPAAPSEVETPSEFFAAEAQAEPAELAAFNETETLARVESAELVSELPLEPEPATQPAAEDLSQFSATQVHAEPAAESELTAFSEIEVDTEAEAADFGAEMLAEPELATPPEEARVEPAAELEPATFSETETAPEVETPVPLAEAVATPAEAEDVSAFLAAEAQAEAVAESEPVAFGETDLSDAEAIEPQVEDFSRFLADETGFESMVEAQQAAASAAEAPRIEAVEPAAEPVSAVLPDVEDLSQFLAADADFESLSDPDLVGPTEAEEAAPAVLSADVATEPVAEPASAEQSDVEDLSQFLGVDANFESQADVELAAEGEVEAMPQVEMAEFAGQEPAAATEEELSQFVVDDAAPQPSSGSEPAVAEQTELGTEVQAEPAIAPPVELEAQPAVEVKPAAEVAEQEFEPVSEPELAVSDALVEPVAEQAEPDGVASLANAEAFATESEAKSMAPELEPEPTERTETVDESKPVELSFESEPGAEPESSTQDEPEAEPEFAAVDLDFPAAAEAGFGGMETSFAPEPIVPEVVESAAPAPKAPPPPFQSIDIDSLPRGVLQSPLMTQADPMAALQERLAEIHANLDSVRQEAASSRLPTTLDDVANSLTHQEPRQSAKESFAAAAMASTEEAFPAESFPDLATTAAPAHPASDVTGGAVAVVGEDVLIESMYHKILPRMKVELGLWLQDALELQTRQLLSGVMLRLKEDYDQMFGETLRESLRQAINDVGRIEHRDDVGRIENKHKDEE